MLNTKEKLFFWGGAWFGIFIMLSAFGIGKSTGGQIILGAIVIIGIVPFLSKGY